MDKKELKAQSEIIEGQLGYWTRLKIDTDRLISELAESEKPELRHGDYGWTPKGFQQIMVKTGDDSNIFAGSGFASVKEEFEGEEVLEAAIGNIFDDLKAMQEDLTEFDVGNNHFLMASGFVSVVDTSDGDRVDFEISDLLEIALNLRCLRATHLRKQANDTNN